ncbi:hypothetical protein L228DRAFT_93119 [Xylona heveae TC161]|uniref:SP-RING-type domain-containing protein n=1 Tax=Xylona heveae (strain CBS 132557 / TC161) TaxID=1328760 RepID=A0A161TPU4_XYLHT|nr:hypothetical protein L228DRAFT_93119 [Xylona heveae TC161]KZF24276.1 hypothetical protein L228DRAFT_93119 [Xylona heveae TC161]
MMTKWKLAEAKEPSKSAQSQEETTMSSSDDLARGLKASMNGHGQVTSSPSRLTSAPPRPSPKSKHISAPRDCKPASVPNSYLNSTETQLLSSPQYGGALIKNEFDKSPVSATVTPRTRTNTGFQNAVFQSNVSQHIPSLHVAKNENYPERNPSHGSAATSSTPHFSGSAVQLGQNASAPRVPQNNAVKQTPSFLTSRANLDNNTAHQTDVSETNQLRSNVPGVGSAHSAWSPRIPAGYGNPLSILQLDLLNLSVRQDQPKPSPTIEDVRFMLLQDACQAGDWFFIHFHRLCIKKPQLGQRRSRLVDAFGREFDNPFEMLDSLLLPVKNLEYIIQFATFPNSIRLQMSPADWYLFRSALPEIKEFLLGLPTKLPALRYKCINRHIPPTPQEIANDLGLSSIILQRVIFLDVVNYIFLEPPLETLYYLGDLFRSQQREVLPLLVLASRRGGPAPHFCEYMQNQEKVLKEAFEREYAKHRQAVPFPQAVRMNGWQSITRPEELLTATDRHYWLMIGGPGLPAAREELKRHMQRLREFPHAFATDSRVAFLRGVSAPTYQGDASAGLHAPQPGGHWGMSAPGRHNVPSDSSGAGFHSQQVPPQPNEARAPIAPRSVLDQLIGPSLNPLSLETNETVNRRYPRGSMLQEISPPNPVLRCVNYTTGDNGTQPRYYQYVKAWALLPKTLEMTGKYRCVFGIDPATHGRIAKIAHTTGDPPFMRLVGPGSITYRLRCCDMENIVGGPVIENQSQYAKFYRSYLEAKTRFPPLHFMFMGVHPVFVFQARQATACGQHFPIDLTDLVRPGMVNTLVVHTIRANDQRRDTKFLLTIEILEVSEHDSIVKELVKNYVKPAEATIAEIKQCLSQRIQPDPDHRSNNAAATHDNHLHNNNNSGEIPLSDDNIVIDLRDPFSGRMFNIPARSRHCYHRECFDLETYLSARPRRAPDSPSDPDEWQCPICKNTATPIQLIVDGFLVNVRKQLEEEDLLDTTTITVEKDGSWRPNDISGKPKPPIKRSSSAMAQGSDDDNDGERNRKRPTREEIVAGNASDHAIPTIEANVVIKTEDIDDDYD